MSFICQYKFKVFWSQTSIENIHFIVFEAKQALKKYTNFHLKVFFRDVYGLG